MIMAQQVFLEVPTDREHQDDDATTGDAGTKRKAGGGWGRDAKPLPVPRSTWRGLPLGAWIRSPGRLDSATPSRALLEGTEQQHTTSISGVRVPSAPPSASRAVPSTSFGPLSNSGVAVRDLFVLSKLSQRVV